MLSLPATLAMAAGVLVLMGITLHFTGRRNTQLEKAE